MKLSRSRLVPVVLCAIVLLALCAARWLEVGLFERLELVSYDFRVRSSVDRSDQCATNLGFIFVDNATIDGVREGVVGGGFGLYWPRHVYGHIASQAAVEGAKVIAFDVLFGELRNDQYGFDQTGELIEFDKVFADQLRNVANVMLACEEQLIPPRLFLTNAAALGDISTDKDADGVLRRVRAFRDYTVWHPAFERVQSDPAYGVDLSKAEVVGQGVVLKRLTEEDIIVPLDQEGMFALADFYGEELPDGMPAKAHPFEVRRVWHMGLVVAARELGYDLDDAQVDLDHGTITLTGGGGRRIIPVDRDASFYIDWAIPVNDPRLHQEPALNLLRRSAGFSGNENPEAGAHWSGKLVIVGSIATGNDLSDMGATPLHRNTFLVSKHWNVANSIIMDRFIIRGGVAQETGVILIAGLLAGLFALQLRPIAAFIVTATGLAGYVILAFVLYSSSRIWIPLAMPIMAGVSLYVVIATWRVLFEQDERRHVKSVFSKVVSPNVVSELLGAKELALGGARREITVFFADVRGFTTLTDQAQQAVDEEVKRLGLTGGEAKALVDQQAKETLSTVNMYLALVADVVKKHNGTLDKYIGDCVMAFWGAPTPNPQHALYCVRAAIDAQRAIESVNRERVRANESNSMSEGQLPVLSLGTGINTGEVTVGLMGSDAHILSYTVFGREVNVASRLEGVSGRGRVIIGEGTYQHLLRDDPELAALCIALESVSVKGIREQVRIYEVPWRSEKE